MMGNSVEWYDYGLYGYLSPILATLFFPSGDPLTSLMAALGVFAAGFLMRPLEAVALATWATAWVVRRPWSSPSP